jgi:hypothetical protein
VTAAFYTDTDKAAALKLFVDENFPECFKDDLEWQDSPAGRAGYLFSVADLKWYESYPEIQGFNEFVEKYNEIGKDAKWSYEFLRLGEEDTDIQYECDGENVDYVLQVIREIRIEF